MEMEYREPLAAGWVIAWIIAGLIILGALTAFGIRRYYACRRIKGKPGQPKTMTAVTARPTSTCSPAVMRKFVSQLLR